MSPLPCPPLSTTCLPPCREATTGSGKPLPQTCRSPDSEGAARPTDTKVVFAPACDQFNTVEDLKTCTRAYCLVWLPYQSPRSEGSETWKEDDLAHLPGAFRSLTIQTKETPKSSLVCHGLLFSVSAPEGSRNRLQTLLRDSEVIKCRRRALLKRSRTHTHAHKHTRQESLVKKPVVLRFQHAHGTLMLLIWRPRFEQRDCGWRLNLTDGYEEVCSVLEVEMQNDEPFKGRRAKDRDTQ
ncbi:uncharacterized protein LOC125158685 [Prionailurus viverrinus]|uniref:uncharacterized protein LOC125158685 n=1 Tax=Prionailurus viverrinus TaxID=61388 RepID=UPI001FF1FB29|nr:uncharacterized protein LOC125158685 [Prionailurus viverrinus]